MKKRIGFLVVLCLIGSLLMSCGERTQKMTLQQGRELEEQGKYPEALAYYQKMPESDFRAVCIQNLRYLYGEILDAMLAQQQNPTAAESNFAIGQAYYAKAQTFPTGPAVMQNLWFDTTGYFADRRRQFHANAVTAIETATQQRADYAEALFIKGQAYEALDQPQQAMAAYQQLVALPGKPPDALARLGLLLYKNGQPFEGQRYVNQAVKNAPANAEAHFTFGLILAQEGADVQAIHEFQQTLCANPQHVAAYSKLAQVYLQQNNIIDAERVLQLGVMNNPEAVSLGITYNSLHGVLNSREEAEALSIMQQLTTEVPGIQAAAYLATVITQGNVLLQLRFLRLRLDIIQRQRPYLLPCSGITENPYFERQIALFQEKIKRIETTAQQGE